MQHLPAGLVLLSVALELALGSPTLRDEEAFLSEALGIQLVAASRLDTPDAGESGRIAEATGREAASFAEIALWEGLAADDRVLRIARRELAGQGAGAERSVLFALTQTGAFAAAAVLDEGGRPLAEWTHFLDTFGFYEVPRLEGSHPRAYLNERREETREGQDEETRLTFALLEILGAMNEQAAAFNIPAESKTQSPAEEAQTMATAYARVGRLADALAPLLGNATEKLASTAQDSSAAAAEMAQAILAEDQALVETSRVRILSNCRTCHNLSLKDGRGKLKDAFPLVRAELGIGDGYYQLGHDVRIRHADRPRAQRVADALREAALALDLILSR